jgi:hypothetical protein
MARPSKRSEITREIAVEAIINGISCGQTMSDICRSPGMPCRQTIYNWIEEDAEFSARMEVARALGADAIAEDALHIADTPQLGERVEESEDGIKTIKEDMLGHRKLQVWARLQLLAKWHPKKYGDKVDVAHSGNISVQTVSYAQSSGAKT